MFRHSILIVDDDPGAREAFAPMLTARGYDVRVATNAEAGLREVELHTPSVIILDLHLPVVDGLEFLRRLRSTIGLSTVPTAVVTGDYLIDELITKDLEHLGAKLYFKPLWEEDLARIIEAMLSQAPAARRDANAERTCLAHA
jgi:DNA-binding response OmpR family regulator